MNKKEQIWLGLFCVLPVIGAKALADSIAPNDNMKLLYAAMFGGFATLIGYGIYYTTKNRSNSIRAISLALVIGALTTTVVVASNNSYPQTCHVCGYKAIEKGDPTCGYCYEEVSEERMKEKGYNSLSELVYARQLYVFYQDSLEQVDFYKPEVSEEGFQKNKDWKPLITREDLRDVHEELKAEK
ncbi:hypothetical protein [Pontibacter roseus]|uniref:hypothetical protein n=1 Tax=Pontibacter roseus TaxID=336989 RepID=UPI00036194B6|nr:hypothetical protein [Pontibacter roseus]